MKREAGVLMSILLLAGCVQRYDGPPLAQAPQPSGPALMTQDQTAGLEEQDRINRFRRLAAQYGAVQPSVDEITLAPGSVDFMSGPVPVVRVVFPERAFFAFDSATPLPSSEPILNVIAENMKRDVPDAALTVLGHTDAIGTDPYNVGLSRRRAEAVMAALVARGVNPEQLSEVAIGKRQPIAPNDTAAGRALNRRVEFLVSPAMSANLAAIQQRVVPQSYFETGLASDATRRALRNGVVREADLATVYKLKPEASSENPGTLSDVGLAPLGNLALTPASPQSIKPLVVTPSTTMAAAINSVHLASLAPASPVHLLPVQTVDPLKLDADPGPTTY